ncbi:hypothetical protein GH714_024496 [Hevea brasiliensis]|uniref:Nucleotide-diphospho-sugar transferase domain-containing protein n=1 Tax=Hevea brasiliensis TaxID=3981 RepID=A0A6A6M186_HEVBR|nr:hypothetical protein GH714_024496 [Hevea brasiliensis]
MLGQNFQWNHCDDRIFMAWNSRNVPLHNGVLPPFLYGKGIHNHWVINEAVSSEFRFVFDASSTISSFYLNDDEHQSNQSVKSSIFSDVKNRSWENVGNFHLGATYGSFFFHEIKLRHLQVSNFLICALDQETYEFSVLQGLPVFYDPSAPKNISFDDCHFGTTCFQRVTKVKSKMVLRILKLGYNVLLSDVDVYWFANPLPILRSYGPAVLVAQSDEYNKAGPVNLPRRLNSGFYFAHSDGSTIAAMEKVVKHATTSGLSEQPSFYDTLWGRPMAEEKCEKSLCKDGLSILHNNWISGRVKKLERQACIHLFGQSRGSHEESRRKKEFGNSPITGHALTVKRFSVRIVHAGGQEELYQHAVPASHLMEKYPGMCVARPEVFRNPQQSLLCPDENLLLVTNIL